MKTFKLYDYINGWDKPKLLATNVGEIKELIIDTNYMGRETEHFTAVIEHYRDGDDLDIEGLREDMDEWGLFFNPTLETLVEETFKWIGRSERNFPYQLLQDFGTEEEILSILKNRKEKF